MKALASADLNSHIYLVQQFLNIGKPFLLEGIGSLVRIRSGICEFTAGALLAEKLKEPTNREQNTSGQAEGGHTYEPFLEKEKIQSVWSKPVLALLAIVGIGLAVLGGYTIYKKNAAGRQSSPGSATIATTLVTDSALLRAKDSAFLASQAAIKKEAGFKYVLETANRKRAFYRYKVLQQNRWNVQMETTDSIRYKLFMFLPSLAIDTAHVRDSLTVMNGRKVYIEN